MSCSCSEPRPAVRPSCPRCGAPGKITEEITLKALLRPEALARRSENAHRFCATSECPVVYFGNVEVFERSDLDVPVFQKEPDPGCPVCYCFGITGADIRAEMETAGRSTAVERIRALVQADRCACELRNPQGYCCLGNVSGLVTRLSQGRESTATSVDH